MPVAFGDGPHRALIALEYRDGSVEVVEVPHVVFVQWQRNRSIFGAAEQFVVTIEGAGTIVRHDKRPDWVPAAPGEIAAPRPEIEP